MDSAGKRNREFFTRELLFRTLSVVFILGAAFLAFVDFKIYDKRREVQAQISGYQKQIAQIKRSSQDLKNEIANADNVDYLEKVAYEQLGEQKPGEKEVIFIAPQGKQKEIEKTQNSWPNWFSSAWQWIKSKF